MRTAKVIIGFAALASICTAVAAPSRAPKAIPHEIPGDWKLEEIAEAVGGGDGRVYVLAWCRKKDDRDFLIDSCLAVKVQDDNRGFLFANLFRHPEDEKPEWHQSMMHATGGKAGPTGRWYFHYKHFKDKPTNRQIYDAFGFEDLYWSFKIEKDYMIVGCGVCEKSWKEAIGEKPTRYFDR